MWKSRNGIVAIWTLGLMLGTICDLLKLYVSPRDRELTILCFLFEGILFEWMQYYYHT